MLKCPLTSVGTGLDSKKEIECHWWLVASQDAALVRCLSSEVWALLVVRRAEKNLNWAESALCVWDVSSCVGMYTCVYGGQLPMCMSKYVCTNNTNKYVQICMYKYAALALLCIFLSPKPKGIQCVVLKSLEENNLVKYLHNFIFICLYVGNHLNE